VHPAHHLVSFTLDIPLFKLRYTSFAFFLLICSWFQMISNEVDFRGLYRTLFRRFCLGPFNGSCLYSCRLPIGRRTMQKIKRSKYVLKRPFDCACRNCRTPAVTVYLATPSPFGVTQKQKGRRNGRPFSGRQGPECQAVTVLRLRSVARPPRPAIRSRPAAGSGTAGGATGASVTTRIQSPGFQVFSASDRIEPEKLR
jgi:hypothetical protein